MFSLSRIPGYGNTGFTTWPGIDTSVPSRKSATIADSPKMKPDGYLGDHVTICG